MVSERNPGSSLLWSTNMVLMGRRFKPAFDSVPFAGGFHFPHPWKEVPRSGLSGICSSDFGPVEGSIAWTSDALNIVIFREKTHLPHQIQPVDPTQLVESVAPEALISCMVLDVFHPWPRDALIDVAESFMVVLEKNIPNEDETLMMVDDDDINGIRWW